MRVFATEGGSVEVVVVVVVVEGFKRRLLGDGAHGSSVFSLSLSLSLSEGGGGYILSVEGSCSSVVVLVVGIAVDVVVVDVVGCIGGGGGGSGGDPEMECSGRLARLCCLENGEWEWDREDVVSVGGSEGSLVGGGGRGAGG